MNDKKTGGPAFPAPTPRADNGMTLRDYFAAQALAGIMSNATDLGTLAKEARATGKYFSEIIAETAFDVADAMLIEREA